MGIEFVGPNTSGNLVLTTEPGMFITGKSLGGMDAEATVAFSGSQGARALTRLIDAATELRAGLRDA